MYLPNIRQTLMLFTLLFVVMSCRNLSSKSLPEESVTNSNSDAFCDVKQPKYLDCNVRDVSTRNGSREASIKKSELTQASLVQISVYPPAEQKDPEVLVFDKTASKMLAALDKSSDLYLRNGCLAEINGGSYSEGQSPRVSMKVLINSKKPDQPVYIEVTDYRFKDPIYMSFDLQCERKSSR